MSDDDEYLTNIEQYFQSSQHFFTNIKKNLLRFDHFCHIKLEATKVVSILTRIILKIKGDFNIMIPSQTWFPTSWAERAIWFQNFQVQFSAVALSLGFTAADIAEVDKDNEIIQFLANTMVQMDAFDDAVRQYRRIITTGDIGDPIPSFPANPTFALPASQPTGIFERLNKLRERIMVAPNYTNEIGALLQILPSTPDSISPELVKPTIKITAAQTGYLFSVVVEKREKADMWDVLTLRKGATSWETVKTAVGKSVDVVVSPQTAGESEQIQVRVQLKLKNANYGQPSDIVYVTVNP